MNVTLWLWMLPSLVCLFKMYRVEAWAKNRIGRSVFWSTAIRNRCCFASTSGTIYDNSEASTGKSLQVTLFTKEGCTLCDKVVDVLRELRVSHPHSLQAVDITDPDQTYYWDRYKYDIPVLHLNSIYWTKHRLTKADAEQVLTTAASGTWQPPNAEREEPNAAKLERL